MVSECFGKVDVELSESAGRFDNLIKMAKSPGWKSYISNIEERAKPLEDVGLILSGPEKNVCMWPR